MSNPRHRPPRLSVEIHDPGPTSFAEEMATIVNEARSIHTELGFRPYRVFSVRVSWSGGERGRGDVNGVYTREFVPRPKVDFRTRRELVAGGIVERGVAVLTEIDPQLTAEEVADLFHCECPIAKGVEAFFEIAMDGRDGGLSQRRRYVLAAPPVRQGFDWRVELRQQDGGRTPEGAIAYPGRRPGA